MGGTTEAPSWLTPAASPNHYPGGAAGAWPHMQDNYGAVKLGGPANGLGQATVGGSFPAKQPYGGAKVASPVVNPA